MTSRILRPSNKPSTFPACAAALILFQAIPEASASSGPAPPVPSCRIPEPKLPLERAATITMNKTWGWGKFRNIGNLVTYCTAPVQSTPGGNAQCPSNYRGFLAYEIWHDTSDRWIPLTNVQNGYNVRFQKFNDTWLALYYLWRTSDDELLNRPGGCGDLRAYRGLAFNLWGSSKLRIVVGEGLGGRDQGEEYHVLLDTDPIAPQSVTIPFERFTRRLDYQYPYHLPKYDDGRLDLSRIRGITWEAMCPYPSAGRYPT